MGPLHYSHNINDKAKIVFTGRQVQLVFTGYKNSGKVKIVIDGKTTKYINLGLKKQAWQRVWTSPLLSRGRHTITVVHSSGKIMDVDAFIVNQR